MRQASSFASFVRRSAILSVACPSMPRWARRRHAHRWAFTSGGNRRHRARHHRARAGALLEKDITHDPFVTRLHLADTSDGVVFTNDHVVSGVTDSRTTFVGPRGTIVKYADNRYGSSLCRSGWRDADAFHYIGYAESADLSHWSVVHGVDNPLVVDRLRRIDRW